MKTKYFPLNFVFIISFLIIGCSEGVDSGLNVRAFPDVLDIKGVPEKPGDLLKYCFSDLGAWHGFALPDISDSSLFGGFIGPFLMEQNRWLSQCLAKLIIYDAVNNRKIDLSRCHNPQLNYFPGLLIQLLQVDSMSVKLELCFVSSRSVLMRAVISNLTSKQKQLRLGWQGDVFQDKAFFELSPGVIAVKCKESEACINLVLPPDIEVKTTISNDKKSYCMEGKSSISLASGQSCKTHLIQTVCFNGKEQKVEEQLIEKVFSAPDKIFKETEKRWNRYLKEILLMEDDWRGEKAYQDIAVKCLETLITNWRSPAGDLTYSGLYPSYQRFHGFWAWDSWKHAAALALFAPELAKDQIRAMFAYQDSYGMIPDVIRLNKNYNNLRNTKPPLAAWAVWLVYEQTKDREFLEEMYSGLVSYHHWWYSHRDHDQNGLCEYGSNDGTLTAAAWESGMDNAVRFDNAAMLQNDSHSWSLDRESVDLNAYLYAEKRYLSLIAKTLGNIKDKNNFNRDAEALKLLIQNCMFDNETGYFYDIRLDGKGFCKIQGPEGWIPLWAGVATPEQAERVKYVLLDSTKFTTYIPFPTVAADNGQFIPTYDGYWRGPVWLDQAYFAIKGLECYGYKKEAIEFTCKIFNRLEGLKKSVQPIYENYNPVNGNGLNARHFSWSAAHLLLLFNLTDIP